MSGNGPKLDLEINEINDNLAHIFHDLGKKPLPGTDLELKTERLPITGDGTKIEEPVTNIDVPAFTTADVQIKYYDLENREYTNVYKINNLYGGLYDIDKREPINDNSYEIFKK